jgi:hypothetical protein
MALARPGLVSKAALKGWWRMLQFRFKARKPARVFVAMVIPGFVAPLAWAGFMDMDARSGLQSVSWLEGTAQSPRIISVYIPVEITGKNRTNFELGIKSMTAVLPKIGVEFLKGEPPTTKGATNYVDVNVSNEGLTGNIMGNGGAFAPAPFPANQNHAMVSKGEIQIHTKALSMPNILGDLMKNLGAHEFGHVLGLADDMSNPNNRLNVMDPSFSFEEGFGVPVEIIGADPFVGPSARDLMMLKEHYMITRGAGGAKFGELATGAVGELERKKQNLSTPSPGGFTILIVAGLFGSVRRRA